MGSSPLSLISRSLVIVISGPSGVGKGTVIDELLAMRSDVRRAVSVTTRAPRPWEIDGVNYHFTSVEQFKKLLEGDSFLEYEQPHSTDYYGSLRSEYAQEAPLLSEVDLRGGRSLKQIFSQVLFIYLAPPSIEELRRRLVGRGSETEDKIASRLRTALREQDEVIRGVITVDHYLVNFDSTVTAQSISSMIDQALVEEKTQSFELTA